MDKTTATDFGLFRRMRLATKFSILVSATLLVCAIGAIFYLNGQKEQLSQIVIKATRSTLQEAGVKLERNVERQFQQAIAGSFNGVVASFTAILLVMSIVVGVAVYWLFLLLVRTRLTTLSGRFESIAAGGGDLTQRVEVNGNDGIDLLGLHFNGLLEKMQNTIGQVTSAAKRVSNASTMVSSITNEAIEKIMQQKRDTEMVATAMNEITATVHDVARNATSAAEAAQTAEKEAKEGRHTVEATINAISALADEVKRANDVIQRLKADSQDIGSVLDVIQGIAEQTNLLALNAAIEAARAGEQGRGFAVVADEVRTLASRTQESTQEIQKMIEKLQSGANDAARVMDVGHGQAQASVEQATKAGAALERITSSVVAINERNTQIATAAEEQSAVVREMDANISSINNAANGTADAAKNIVLEIEQMVSLAAELNQAIGEFKV